MIQTIYQVVTFAGTVLAAFGAVFAWQFVFQYSRVNWHRYEAGRHLMSFTKGLAYILTYVVAVAVAGSVFADTFQPVSVLMAKNSTIGLFLACGRTAIFGWMCWQLWKRLQMLERYQSGREDASEGDTREPSDAEPQY